MAKTPGATLSERVNRCASSVLQRDGEICMIPLLLEMGLLVAKDVEEWRRGHVPFLERVINTNLTRLLRIQMALRTFTRERELHRWEGKPLKRGRRYSKSGADAVEREYGARYVPKSVYEAAVRKTQGTGDSNM